MPKIQTDLTDLQSTLFLPLYARFQETYRKGVIDDPQSIQMMRLIDFNYGNNRKRIDGIRRDWAVLLCIVVRTQIVDRLTRKFIKHHPKCVIINLGCGLCTRFSRVDNGKILWFDLDLPNVIDLKRRFTSETDRYRFMSKSIFDPSWVTEIQEVLGDRTPPVLFIAEGLLFYLEKRNVELFFKLVAKEFPRSEFIFECANQFLKLLSPFFSSMRGTNSRFKWAIHNLTALNKWVKGIGILGEYFYYNQYKRRWHYFSIVNTPPWSRFLLRMVRIAYIKMP